MSAEKRIEGNIWRYHVFETLCHTPFMLPVIVMFWVENGLDPFDIYLLQGLYAISVVILEVPTGMVADRLGKKTSLIISGVMMSAGFAIYAASSTFLFFFLAEIVLAVAASLLSGADSALLYDTLRALDRQDEYKKIEGKARANQMISFAVCNVLGGLVGSFSLRAAIWLTVVGPVLAFVVVLGFVEANPITMSATGTPENARRLSYRELIRNSLKFVWKHRLVRWQIAFLAILSGSGTWLLWLYQPYMEFSGLPVAAFGIAFASFNLFAAWMSRKAQRFDEKFGRTGSLVVLSVMQIAPLPLMALIVTPFSCLFIMGQQTVRSVSRIVISDRILNYTFADKRATVLSLGSMGGRLFFAATAPVIGWVAGSYSMRSTLLIQGGALFVLLSALLVAYRRIPAKYFVVKESVKRQQ